MGILVFLSSETEHVTPEQTDESKAFPDDAIKPLETKALNFLVNQYLLQINSKLTAVTFSEENEEQVIIWENQKDVFITIRRHSLRPKLKFYLFLLFQPTL